jgi:hypothetical protein
MSWLNINYVNVMKTDIMNTERDMDTAMDTDTDRDMKVKDMDMDMDKEIDMKMDMDMVIDMDIKLDTNTMRHGHQKYPQECTVTELDTVCTTCK